MAVLDAWSRHASNGASPNAHLLIGEMPAPRLFEGRWWEGTGLSIAAHAIAMAALLYAASHVTQVVQTATTASERFNKIVFQSCRPWRRRGGGGTMTPDPPRRPRLRRRSLSSCRRCPIRPILPRSAGAEDPGHHGAGPADVAWRTTQLDTSSLGRGTGPGGGGGRGPGSGPGRAPVSAPADWEDSAATCSGPATARPSPS